MHLYHPAAKGRTFYHAKESVKIEDKGEKPVEAGRWNQQSQYRLETPPDLQVIPEKTLSKQSRRCLQKAPPTI